MGRAIGVAVGVAIETGGAAARLRRAAILGLVELLLRERRHQEAEPLQLLGIEDPGEERVVVVDRHQLALRHVAEIGPGRQINRRRKLRQQVIRQVEIEVEAGEVASLLLLQLVNLKKAETPCRLRHGWGAAVAESRAERDPGRGSDPGSAPPASPSWYLPAA